MKLTKKEYEKAVDLLFKILRDFYQKCIDNHFDELKQAFESEKLVSELSLQTMGDIEEQFCLNTMGINALVSVYMGLKNVNREDDFITFTKTMNQALLFETMDKVDDNFVTQYVDEKR